METDLPWFGELSAQDRSWVGLIVQAGIKGFVTWYREGGANEPTAGLAADVFGAAPRALTGVINLQQTVDLVRLSIDVVEQNIDSFIDAEDAPGVHAAILRYAREMAFATAQVHARAAEVRGAWDARLEALVVDSVLRSEADEAVLSRASALGWAARGYVCVVVGLVPPERPASDIFDDVRRSARDAGMDALCAIQGDRIVAILGGVEEPRSAAKVVAEHFADGPLVSGPLTTDLASAHVSARAAMSAMRVALAWPGRPRPVTSDELLPERALAGDGHARRQLVEEVYTPLAEAKGLLETLNAYFDHGTSIEASARALFVHPNTVRYRLKSAADLTGLTPTDPRDAFTYTMALVLGRLHDL